MSVGNLQLAHEVIAAVERRDLAALGKSSGVEGETQSGFVVKFRERKVVLFRPFRDPEKALEAIGLAE